MSQPRHCIVCSACAQLKAEMTPEIVVMGAVLHGMAAGAIPGARPSLCPEHDLVRAMLLATLDHERANESAGEPLRS
jgi:hypothetical protein